MQAYLDSLHKLGQCYSKYPLEGVSNLTGLQFRNLCLAEQRAVAENLFSEKLTTTNIVKEKLILNERKAKETVQTRREQIEQIFRD